MKGSNKTVLFSILLAISICVIVSSSLNFVAATNPTLAINTSATGYTAWGNSVQVTLTTTSPNTLLYVSVAERPGAAITGVSSNPSLSWIKRGGADSYWYAAHLETWYATWTPSGTITITISMSSQATATVVAFAVTGADLASPFDGNARIATSNAAGQMWPGGSISITTSNPNDLIIGATGVTGYSDLPSLTPGSGFSLIQTRASTGMTIETSTQYKVVSTIQSGLQISYSYSSVGYGSMIADAVKAVTVQPTTLTVACSPETVDKSSRMQTTISGTLTSGSTGIGDKTIVLTFNGGQSVGSATTEADGSYEFVWTVPSSLANGFYVVRADFAGDNQPYLSCFDETTYSLGGGGLFVVPESLFGGLAALAACFVGFAVYKKRQQQH